MFMVKGIITALITPFDNNGDLCIDCLKSLIDFQVEKGVAGLFISGTYGEGIITPLSTREKLISKAIEYTPSKSIVLPHVGGAELGTIVRLTKLAKDLGYSAVSIVGPIFHTPTRTGLIKFYKYVAEKTDMPIVIYNNKSRQGYNISPEDFDVVSREVNNIVGIKDTSYDVDQLLELVKKFGSRYFVAGAGDSMLLYTFLIGAHAHICGIANVFPELVVELYKAIINNEYKKAIEIHYKLLLVRKTLRKYGIEMQEVLRAMLKLRGVESGHPPIQLSYNLTDQQILELKDLINQLAVQ